MAKDRPKLGVVAPTIGHDRGGSRSSHPVELSSRTFPSIDCELTLA
jgi:hypothetical protein